jgi:hypothetical protein
MKKNSRRKSGLNQKQISGKTPEAGQKTHIELLAEKENRPSEYNREKKIKEGIDKMSKIIPRIIWGINTFPLFIFLYVFTIIAIIITFPLSFIIWLIVGDRPIRRMQPTNFFYLISRGMTEGAVANYTELPLNLESETPFMRIVYQLSSDLRINSDYHYKGIYNFFILGETHPILQKKYSLLARLVGLAIYGFSTYPFFWAIKKIVINLILD